MNSEIGQLAVVSEMNIVMPPTVHPADAEVDLDILKSIPKKFCIEDEKTCNWWIKKIVAARNYAEHVKQYAEAEIKRAKREEHTLWFLFARQAEAWLRIELEKSGGRRRSIALPAGTLGLRSQPALLVVDDDDVVLGWCKHNCPSAIVVVEKLSRSILKDHFSQSGEMPDSGCHLDPGGDRLHVK
jgi:hypothetical protein